MKTTPITTDDLASSVIAVPPLARNSDYSLNREANQQLVSHLEEGGIRALLYGGNANLYHVRPSEYEGILGLLEGVAGAETLVVPAVGPSFGVMMDQVDVLRDFSFPTAMVLPQRDLVTMKGVERGIRMFAESLGKPVVVYLKHEGYLEARQVQSLVEDGLVSWIKYAVVRDDPGEDPLLRELVECVDPNLIVSGIGEQPATVHLRDFGICGFTSGCVCLAPRRSQEMLCAIQNQEWDRAEELREQFRPLEDLRNGIHPVRVLHEAVTQSQIADMGPILPLLSGVEESEVGPIREAAVSLLAGN